MNVFNTLLPTLLDTTRICNLIKFAVRANKTLDSNAVFAEFGSYKCGSGEIIAKACPNRPLFLIDSFQGLPEGNTEKGDAHFQGEFADVDYIGTAGYFKMLYPNVRLLKGFSPSVFEFFSSEVKFTFLHIDCDLYQSCKDAATFFWPRLMKGGYMLWDDYGFASCRGAKNYIDEFAQDLECQFKGELIDPDGISSKQYLIIK
jgi:O-methyltransferase